MDRIKSIFLTTAITLWICMVIWAMYNGVIQQDWFLGTLIAASLPPLFIGYLFVFKPARTSAKLKGITFSILIALAFEFEAYLNDNSVLIGLGLSVLSLALWIAYINWYSVFPERDSSILKVGKHLPKLTFLNSYGEKISNHQFKGKKLIYLFYRGNWCPLCMAQVKEISDQYKEISEMGTEVLLISPQPHKFTIGLAKKMNVAFQFLCDEKSKVAKQLGIFSKGGTPFGLEALGFDSDTVLPTVIITDETGKIIFVDQTDNYRVRPEPSTFLEVLKTA